MNALKENLRYIDMFRKQNSKAESCIVIVGIHPLSSHSLKLLNARFVKVAQLYCGNPSSVGRKSCA